MTNGHDNFQGFVRKVAEGTPLDGAEAEAAFTLLMEGEATPAQAGAFLMALRVRGETVDEIAGAARVMRAKATRIKAPEDAIDTCGTGGDGLGTLNISTAVAFVAAGCGVPVAKHGNRAISSRSGSSDVLTALGVNVEIDHALVQHALDEAGVCFLMAPRHHQTMRHVGSIRAELGVRTVFNLVGPLSNPGFVRRQVIGVFSSEWLEPLAQVLAELGSEHVWVVHGADGMDEISTTGTSRVASLQNGKVKAFEVTPEDAGLSRARIEDLLGGDVEENAKRLRALLDGENGPYRDIVLLNTAAALIVAGRTKDLVGGVKMAAESIDSGAAAGRLAALAAISHERPAP